MRVTMNDGAFRQGVSARRRGLPISANPFVWPNAEEPRSNAKALAAWWRAGWRTENDNIRNRNSGE